MFDLSQTHKRRMVLLKEQYWMVCYDVGVVLGDEPGIERLTNAKFLALAVCCNAHGDVKVPATAYLIQFKESDLRNPEPR